MTYAQAEVVVWIFLVLNVVSFVLRDIKPFNVIWYFCKCFWMALGLALIIQNVQDHYNKK